MSSPSPFRPDPMPLREALRGLRHFLRRGGETLRDTVQVDALPKPAANLAGHVLREVEALARSVDRAASGLAKRTLGTAGDAPPFDDIIRHPHEDADALAPAIYAALRAVLRRLGASGVFVSEAAALQVFRTAPAEDDRGASIAADLTLRLLAARVLRDVSAADASHVPGAALEPVAVFAVMLWLQASRADDDGEAALDAATDLAVVVAADLAAACAQQDRQRLAALYDEFAAHV